MSASVPLSTYDSARGLSLGRHSELLSVSSAVLSAREALPFLDASSSRCVEAALFFLLPSGGNQARSARRSRVHHQGISGASGIKSNTQ